MVGLPPLFPRLYDGILRGHVEQNRQMAFVSGPRQVGKTTTCKSLATTGDFKSFDERSTSRVILAGPEASARAFAIGSDPRRNRVLVFDELHRFGRWKRFLKGFFDLYGDQVRIVVTGSSRLDVYRRGSDSLMGRYFLYRMHPLTVGELVDPQPSRELVRAAREIDPSYWKSLWEFGGYPEPFLRGDATFHSRWSRLRRDQLVREDLRDLTHIRELAQIEALYDILSERSGSQVNFSNLAREIDVSVDTVRRWITTLSSLHAGFLLRPWFKGVSQALRKEPKWFARDWSELSDPGARAETFVACHLLKAVEGWEDQGLGRFGLSYVRDKQKREADFLVTRDRKPWFLVEVKLAQEHLSPALRHFQQQTGASHAFQVVLQSDFDQEDCFIHERPVCVSARTLLSQLL